jgi:acetylglutamate kinase
MATVLKLGGELLEDPQAVAAAAAAITRLAERESLIVVHGGGRAIDAELRARGLAPRFADGLRVTDAATLETVVSVLAGRTNTALVAALGARGCRAVGLTGADARIGLAVKTAPLATISGARVDLGLVGAPADGDVTLLTDLLRLGYIPVIASVGVDADGSLLNVNADTFAAHLAAASGARRLIVAGTTPGVLDGGGDTIPQLTESEVATLTASGTAHSGMVAKLAACRDALARGVGEVSIVAGRGVEDFDAAVGTRVVGRGLQPTPGRPA